MIANLETILKAASPEIAESVRCAMDTLVASFTKRVRTYEGWLGLVNNECREDWDRAYTSTPDRVIECARTEMMACDAIAWAHRLGCG